MNSNIIIMGPIAVGKTSAGKELAKKLGRKFIDLDDQRKRLYAETDYSQEEAEREYMTGGIMGWYIYQKPYELYSVKRVLEENENAVIAFGGGQSVYEDRKRKREFLRMMESVENSFLLLPYEDVDKSVELLNKRAGEDCLKLNKLFVPAQSARLAAKHVLYVGEKTAAQIAEDITAFIK